MNDLSGGLRLGVDLGGTKIEIVALDPVGNELARRRVPTPQGDYRATLAAIAALVHGVEFDLGRKGRVGIATPGAISPATGRIKNSNSVCLNGRPLDRDIEILLERPIAMANDADCFALSEATDGAGAGYDVVFGVILGTGTGGGIVVRGRLLQGANAIAGEWGHNPLPWPQAQELPGPACYCGKRGCIETFLSGPGLSHDHQLQGGEVLEASVIAARAATGDAASHATLGRYVERLARALAAVINIIDPHVIVLGGGLSQISSLCPEVTAIWDRYVFSDRVDTRLTPALHGDSSGVRGAAWLADICDQR